MPRASRVAIAVVQGFLVVVAPPATAQQHPAWDTETVAIRLWEGAAPDSEGTTPEDTPTLTWFRPFAPDKATATPTAVIVAPGGGYVTRADNHEGRQVANWFNAMGVTAFVLQYRVGPKYRYPVALHDMQRAIRLVRTRAAEFGIAPDRIGVMGFSAGGHLAAMAGTHHRGGNESAGDQVDQASSRPDFLVLGYPVISYIAGWSDPAFRRMAAEGLLGAANDARTREGVSPELAVTSTTPPTFVFSTSQDDLLPPQDHAVLFYQALQKQRVPAELHIFQNGPHGVGLDLADPALGEWPTLLRNWLRVNGWLNRGGSR